MKTKDAQPPPSALYRRQIQNIAARMHTLIAQTALQPLRSMVAFNKAKKNFVATEDAANLCCSVMDSAKSFENEDKAGNATISLMTELVHLKNDASDLVKNEPAPPAVKPGDGAILYIKINALSWQD